MKKIIKFVLVLLIVNLQVFSLSAFAETKKVAAKSAPGKWCLQCFCGDNPPFKYSCNSYTSEKDCRGDLDKKCTEACGTATYNKEKTNCVPTYSCWKDGQCRS